MTLREIVEEIGIDDFPDQCAFVIASTMRTSVQGEPSTFEGECASLCKLRELTGWRVDSPEDIRSRLADLGRFADHDFPDEFWIAIANADQEDDNEDGSLHSDEQLPN